MKPYYRSKCGRWTIYHGDARDLLPGMADASAHAVVTDIPYGEVNRASGGLRNLDKGAADIETFTPAWAAEQAARIGFTVYLWCGMEQVSEIRAALVRCGMTTRLGVWEKSNPSPMNGERMWLSSLEACVFGRHPKAHFTPFCASPVWRGPVERDQVHETQKPVWLMREQVAASVPDDGTVLDFCCGSGTTIVACVKTGMRGIGIEIEERYAEIAAKRLEAECNHLFAEVVP